MPLHIQRPSSLDVSVSNPNETLYIIGDEFTDGSHRIQYNAVDGFGNFETRVSGVWVLGPVVFSDDAWVIDSAGGEFIFASPTDAELVRVGFPA